MFCITHYSTNQEPKFKGYTLQLMDRVKTNYFSGSRVGAEEKKEMRKNDGKIKLSKHKPS